ncbi:hypothetical protein EBU71_14925 [bacterium]|nr:hypothetical protein [Candidatus Elulimicrobium humile]
MPLIKYNNQSLSSITTLPAAIPTGKLKLISSQTASNSTSISFTTGLNSTYKVYKFVFVNMKCASESAFQFNMSTDGGSNYNVTKTTTFFRAYHNTADTSAALDYDTGRDLAQSTAFQDIGFGIVGSTYTTSGSLTLFNPASTTYVKHFIGDSTCADFVFNFKTAGYGNTTSAVNAIQFKFGTGNISDGKIYLYAIDNS